MFEQAKQLLKKCFEKDDIINFRLIGDSLPTLNKWWSLAEINYDFLKQKNDIGYNIYFGGNPRKEKGVEFIPNNISDEEKEKLKAKGKGDDSVEICRSFFVDCDGKDYPGIPLVELHNHLKARLEQLSLPASTDIILTGHGYHLWWKLKEAIPVEKWKPIQNDLIPYLNGDNRCKNPERIMRLPGFLNTKEEPFVDCCIKETNENVYAVEEFRTIEIIGEKEKEYQSTKSIYNFHVLDIEDIIKQEGIKSKSQNKNNIYISCPFTEFHRALSDDKPSNSLGIHGKYKGIYHCFGCDDEKTSPNGNIVMLLLRHRLGDEGFYNQTGNDLANHFQSILEKLNERFPGFYTEKVLDSKENYATEEQLELYREQIADGKVTKIKLSLRNPTKTAWFLHKIFYPDKLIYRNNFEIYGQTDAAGKIHKFYAIADRLEMTENVYQLLRCSVHPVTVGKAKKAVEIYMPHTHVEPKHVEQVLKRLESMKGIHFNPLKYILPFRKNGEPYNQESIIQFQDYDWNWKDKKEVGNASPDVVLHGRLPYNYILGAKLSEAALQYLRSTFSEDTIKLIRNVMKYLLTMSHAEQKMFYITGRKGRGKGVLFYIIIELIGRYNFALVSPHTLADPNKLLKAEGKMLGGCGDTRWGSLKGLAQFAAQQLLAIINREPVELKQLWKDVFETIMDMRVLFCGENLPSELADSGVHLDDKIIVMPVKKKTPNWRKEKSEKKHLRELLTTPEELAGWCNWALGGDLDDIKNREEGELKLDEMTKESSPVHDFVDQCLKFDLQYKIGMRIKDVKYYKYKETLSDLFSVFNWFVDKKNINCKISETEFKHLLESALDNRGEYKRIFITKDIRPKIFVGFYLKIEWKREDCPPNFSNYEEFG